MNRYAAEIRAQQDGDNHAAVRIFGARRAVLAVLASILGVVFLFDGPASSQVSPNVQPITFTLTATNQRSPVFPMNGTSTCSVVVTNAGTGMTLTPQATSDTQANIANGTAQWSTATSIGAGSITSFGQYTGGVAATGLTGFSVVATALGSATVTGSIYCSAAQITGAGGGVSANVNVVNSPTVNLNGPLAFASFPPLANIPYGPLPSPVAVPIGATGTGYQYSLAGVAASTLTCDIENLDGTAVITPYLAVDIANANKYPTSATAANGGGVSNTISTTGVYTFNVGGYYWLDLPITTAGATQNATIQCGTAYGGGGGGAGNSYDSNGYLNVDLAAATYSGRLAVSTPAPAPTATNFIAPSNGGFIAEEQGCGATTTTLATGNYTCVASSNGYKYVNAIGLRDSTATAGIPDNTGIFADGPANAACNGSVAGFPCNLTLTSSTAVTTLVTGVTNKKIYLMGMQVTNSSATGTLLTLLSGTGGQCVTSPVVIWGPQYVPPGGGFMMPVVVVPYTQSATTGYGVCAQTGTSVASVYITAQVAIF